LPGGVPAGADLRRARPPAERTARPHPDLEPAVGGAGADHQPGGSHGEDHDERLSERELNHESSNAWPLVGRRAYPTEQMLDFTLAIPTGPRPGLAGGNTSRSGWSRLLPGGGARSPRRRP